MRTLALLFLLTSGCAYRIGSGVTAGALDELSAEGRSGGLEGATERLLERALLVELGHQLGQGLSTGATEISPEQQAALEQSIDRLLTVAAKRTGAGLRNEVSPELREMVRKDIVLALSEGLRGELGDSLEDTVDRVVARAVISLRANLGDERTRWVVSDLLRDSVYYAMREGQVTPAVGETLQQTLTENMLRPIEQTAVGLTDVVVDKVQEQAKRTENTLKSIISVLVLVSGVFFVLYIVRNRQVQRLQEANTEARRGLRSVDAALDLLDETTREQVKRKLETLRMTEPPGPERMKAPERSDDYLR